MFEFKNWHKDCITSQMESISPKTCLWDKIRLISRKIENLAFACNSKAFYVYHEAKQVHNRQSRNNRMKNQSESDADLCHCVA